MTDFRAQGVYIYLFMFGYIVLSKKTAFELLDIEKIGENELDA